MCRTAPDPATAPAGDVLPVLAGLLQDAVLLAQEGTASPTDIDTAMRLGAGHPTGPLELMDTVPPSALEGLRLSPRATRSPTAPPPRTEPARTWTGPVGVVGTGHMAGGIVEAVARSGRRVHVLAGSTGSAVRLRGEGREQSRSRGVPGTARRTGEC